jgi:16S rRNA (guanine966-N2)-methyltransferase
MQRPFTLCTISAWDIILSMIKLGVVVIREMRPTMGKVMLALFNILGPLNGKYFLDLFAGSGQIAFAAARRNAALVFCVESDRRRYEAIVKAAPLGVKCFCMDVRRAIPKFAKNGEKFDIIFADPPYGLGWGEEFPRVMAAGSAILAEDGVVVFEHSADEEAKDFGSSDWFMEDRFYGDTVLTFYRRRRA